MEEKAGERTGGLLTILKRKTAGPYSKSLLVASITAVPPTAAEGQIPGHAKAPVPHGFFRGHRG